MEKFKELYKFWWFRWTIWFAVGAIVATIYKRF